MKIMVFSLTKYLLCVLKEDKKEAYVLYKRYKQFLELLNGKEVLMIDDDFGVISVNSREIFALKEWCKEIEI